MMERPQGFAGSFDRAFDPVRLHGEGEEARPTYQFAYGCPPTELLPLEEVRAALEEALAAPGGRLLLQYGHFSGYAGLTEALAGRLRSWGLERASLDTLIITCGSTQGLDMVCRALAGPKGTAVTEAPAYPGFLGVAEAGGLALLEVPLDADGLDPERLEHCLSAARKDTGAVPAFVYLIPDYQNPSGVRLHPDRRQALVEVAARAGTVLVEDLTYHELGYDGEDAPPLGSLAPGGVVSLGSFSKVICPGLRLGWLLAERDMIARLRLFGAHLGLSTLLQDMVCRMLVHGTYDTLLERYRRAYRAQRDAMVAALDAHLGPGSDVTFTRPLGGFFVWLRLAPGRDPVRIASRCEAEGVYILPSPMFHPTGRPCPPGLRLAFCFETAERIPEGVARVARALREEGCATAAAGAP